MEMKPKLLLDIDGVLCPWGCENQPEGYEVLELGESWVYISSANTERLMRLAAHFEIVWATAWEEDANAVVGPYHGLHNLTFVKFGTTRLPNGLIRVPARGLFGHSWKWPWIHSFMEEAGCKVAWIDDDIGRERGFADERPDWLFVKTDNAVGLTDEHVELLIGFATEDGNGNTTQDS